MGGFSRRKANTHDKRFGVAFAERLYDGAPRWFSSKWNDHQKRVSGDKSGTFDREPGVRKGLRFAHDWEILFDPDKMMYLWTCVNPHCKSRGQEAWPKSQYRKRPTPADREQAKDLLKENLAALARAKPGDLSQHCPTCFERVYPFPVDNIKKKWVYVLKELGGKLAHYCEIEVEAWNKGKIRRRLKDGQYRDQPAKPFNGVIRLLPKPHLYKWHFFLSPVRLGKSARALLEDSIQQSRSLLEAAKKAGHDKAGVPIGKDLQPWMPTVMREFSRDRVKNPVPEVIPLVDPFVWAAQLVDFDYALVLAALHKLVRDPEEQAKAFIAATLQSAVGRKLVSENPMTWKEDVWDVKDETIKVPYGATGSNPAEAWINRYKAAAEYLSEETNKACARLVFLLRYCLAHRIVEQGCQDGGQEPDRLSVGLMHWNHLLKEMPACDTGRQFIAWLTAGSKSSDQSRMKPADRIPVKNVLEGEDLKNHSKVSKEVQTGLPLSILASLAGGVIARSDKPSQALVHHLANINVKAQSLTNVNTRQESLKLSDLQAGKDLAVNIASGALESYLAKMPESVDFKTAQKYAVATSWKERLSVFDKLSKFENAMSVLTAIKDFSKKSKKYGSGYDEYSRIKGRVQAPVKVANFLAKNTRDLLKFNMTDDVSRVVSMIDTKGAKVVQSLSTAEYNALIGSRAAQSYRLLGTGTRILAGPVGVVLGGAEMVSQSMQTIDSWEADDPGAAVGHGLQAAAGVLIIAVAGAECVALVTGAAAAAWVGPVGWIAAGLMLIAAVVISVWSKNDLELFANHCFLGKNYGGGDPDDKTGKAWMMGKPWPYLRYDGGQEARDQWQRQKLALLRLISGYRTWIGFSSVRGGTVFPSHVPQGSYFEIEVDVTPEGKKSPKEAARLIVWPQHHDSLWLEGSGRVRFTPSAFIVEADPGKARARLNEYQLRVRLNLDGGGRNYLPASRSYVKNETGHGIYESRTSSDVE